MSASSVLAPEGSSRCDPGLVLDGNRSTAWSEGEAGTGAGSWLAFDFGRAVDLRELRVVNGYAKSARLFGRNARAHVVGVTTEQGTVRSILLDNDRPQIVRVAPGPTTWVQSSVIDAYPGSAHEDMLVREVSFVERTG